MTKCIGTARRSAIRYTSPDPTNDIESANANAAQFLKGTLCFRMVPVSPARIPRPSSACSLRAARTLALRVGFTSKEKPLRLTITRLLELRYSLQGSQVDRPYYDAVARIAEEFGIRWVRRPFDIPLTSARGGGALKWATSGSLQVLRGRFHRRA